MGKVCKIDKPITVVNGITINMSKPCHDSNYTNLYSRDVEYIVMHYTGNSKDNAKNNANYFMGANRGTSSHYFVDDDSIWQSVDVDDVAWHCGTSKTYYHPHCRNTNSIGIEMCCTAGNYKIGDKAKENAAQLVAALCEYLEIKDVDEYVVRHYDVTHKSCPAQMKGDNNAEWDAFKKRVKDIMKPTVPVTPPVVSESAKVLYRVRKSWTDTKSQIGAFSNLNNAKSARDTAGAGYYVFDEKGNIVYPEQQALAVGNIVNLVSGAKYTSGKSVPSWVIKKDLYVRGLNGDNVTISTLKTGAITGVVNKQYIAQQEQSVPAKKTILQIAKEVILGKWGNGATRKKKLQEAGYDPDDVQNKVNELL